jgi:hypothetical protein
MTAVKVAAVHAAPVLADRDATIARVVSLAGRAARGRGTLVISPGRSSAGTRTGMVLPSLGSPVRRAVASADSAGWSAGRSRVKLKRVAVVDEVDPAWS